MSGKSVGQTRGGPGQSGEEGFKNFGGIPADTVFRPTGPLPKAAEEALERSTGRRAGCPSGPEAIRHLDDRAVPTHSRHEFRMWEDVLNPKINPLSREDLLAVRQALGNIIPEGGIGKGIAIPGQGRAVAQPPLATRMVKEIEADDVARIRALDQGRRRRPQEWMPKSIPVGIGIPLMRRFNIAGADIPIPTPVKRFTRAANRQRSEDGRHHRPADRDAGDVRRGYARRSRPTDCRAHGG